MSRYQSMFASLKSKSEGAFIPFVMVGDPTLEQTVSIIDALVQGGADALELGIPFSDPIADGPVIQRAGMRALARGANLGKCFEVIGSIRRKHPNLPIGLLIYANLVVHQELDSFYKNAALAGIDSVLVADVPTLEAKPFLQAAHAHEIDPVLILPPNIDERRLEFVAQNSKGYIYVVTRGGVTGADEQVHLSQSSLLSKLKELEGAPPVFGFGISKPEHVQQALRAGALGAISGSAVVRLIEAYSGSSEMLLQLEAFVRSMKNGTVHPALAAM